MFAPRTMGNNKPVETATDELNIDHTTLLNAYHIRPCRRVIQQNTWLDACRGTQFVMDARLGYLSGSGPGPSWGNLCNEHITPIRAPAWVFGECEFWECPERMGLSICKNCSIAVFTDMLCIDVQIDQSPFSCKGRWKKTSDSELQPLSALTMTGAWSQVKTSKESGNKKTHKHVGMYACMYVTVAWEYVREVCMRVCVPCMYERT